MDNGVEFQASASAPSSPSFSRRPHPSSRSSNLSSSVILRSLSGVSIFKRSMDRWSRNCALVPSLQVAVSENPLLILKELLEILLESKVPGPTLVRLENEFTRFAYGRTFEVFGASEDFEQKLARTFHYIPLKDLGTLSPAFSRYGYASRRRTCIAVKRAYVYQPGCQPLSERLSADLSTRAFGQQVSCAYREIEALCFPAFRNHPNIVKLLGWGLCLDSLEDSSPEQPVVPLLFLERAEFTLTAYIKATSTFGQVPHSQYNAICLDIGTALSVIHNSGLAHGDLKPDNVLLFNDPNAMRWTSKLCDFGLMAQENEPGATSPELYRGTLGWTPTKTGKRYTSGSLKQCDIYAFGLIVWCLFTGNTGPPLPLEDSEREGPNSRFNEKRLYFTAAEEIQSCPRLSSTEICRILTVLRACLGHDGVFWKNQPWVYFDENKYQSSVFRYVTGTPSFLMHLVALLRRAASIAYISLLFGITKELKALTYALSFLTSFLFCRIFAWITRILWYTRRGLGFCNYLIRTVLIRIRIRAPKSSTRAKHNRLQRSLIQETANLSRSMKHSVDPDRLEILDHGTTQCYNCDYLVHRLVSLAKKGIVGLRMQEQFYALARLRARLRWCCWSRSAAFTSSGGFNVLDATLHQFVNQKTIAWLCRGPIGAQEVRSLRPLTTWEWISQGVFGRGLYGTGIEGRNHTLLSDVVLERLCLLIQHGFRFDHHISDRGTKKTLFRLILEHVPQYPGRYSPVFIATICKYLVLLSESPHISAPYRYFLTGRGLSDQTGEIPASDDYSTTILHESVLARSHTAVVQVLLSNFKVNALNSQGHTSAQLAFSIWKHHEHGKDSLGRIVDPSQLLEEERILRILEQSELPELYPKRNVSVQTLPPGWETFPVHKFIGFREKHTGSITFIPPTFSLFTDQRLALGFRKIRSMSQQVYHLDLFRFLEPKNGSMKNVDQSFPRTFLHSDRWYQDDIDITNGDSTSSVRPVAHERTPLLGETPTHERTPLPNSHPRAKRLQQHFVIRKTLDLSRYLFEKFMKTSLYLLDRSSTHPHRSDMVENFCIIFIPLCIASEFTASPYTLRLLLSLLSLIYPSFRIRLAVVALLGFHDDTEFCNDFGIFVSVILRYVLIFIPTLMMNGTSDMTKIVMGSALMNLLLGFGIPAIKHPRTHQLNDMSICFWFNVIIYLFSILPTFVFASSFIPWLGQRALQYLGRVVAALSFCGSMLFFGLMIKGDGFFESTVRSLKNPKRALNSIIAHAEPGERLWFVWSTIGIGFICVFPAIVCSNNLVSEVSQMQPSIWKNTFIIVVIPLAQLLQDDDRMMRSGLRGGPCECLGRRMFFAFWVLFNIVPLLVFISWTTGGSFIFYLDASEIISLHSALITLWVVMKGEWYSLRVGIGVITVYVVIMAGLIAF